MQHPRDGERRENDQRRPREQNPAQPRANLPPRGVPRFPEKHDRQKDLQDHVRRQAELSNVVQLMRRHERQRQAQEYKQNGGGNSQPVSQDVPQKNRRGDGDDHFEHVLFPSMRDLVSAKSP